MNAQAMQAIKNYMTNNIISEFVESEAREKVASEIGVNVDDVKLLESQNEKIADRVQQYIAAGYVGCYLKSLELKAA